MTIYGEYMPRNQLSTVASMLADNTRAEMLCVLMDGRAHTGGELARLAGVSASTASEHLSKLQNANLVSIAAQGRHRYFRLAGPEVATMLEALGAAPLPIDDLPSPNAPAALLYARTCYDHLAGELAVRIYDSMLAAGHLDETDSHVVLTDTGASSLAELGVDVDAARATKRPTTRACLDWTERRPHLAGSAATGLLDALMTKKWIARSSKPRAIRVTEAGRGALFAHFDLGDARISA